VKQFGGKLVLFIEIKQLKAMGLNLSQIARQLKISMYLVRMNIPISKSGRILFL